MNQLQPRYVDVLMLKYASPPPHARMQVVGACDMDQRGGPTPESSAAEGGAELLIKFECQVYKLRDDEYVIDLQRLEGDLYIFMDISGRLAADMRI